MFEALQGPQYPNRGPRRASNHPSKSRGLLTCFLPPDKSELDLGPLRLERDEAAIDFASVECGRLAAVHEHADRLTQQAKLDLIPLPDRSGQSRRGLRFNQLLAVAAGDH